MKYELLDAQEAPRPIKKGTTKRMQQSQDIVSKLVAGNVAKVTIGPEDTVRGVKTSLTRAADRLNVSIETWDHAGAVYVELKTKD